MPTTRYRAGFFSVADYAFRDFEAETPEQALEVARRFYEESVGDLKFRSYDDNTALDQIQIWGDEPGTLASWESDDYRLRRAVRELLAALEAQTEAAQAVIDNWPKGDLGVAVRALDTGLAMARSAIARATGRPVMTPMARPGQPQTVIQLDVLAIRR